MLAPVTSTLHAGDALLPQLGAWLGPALLVTAVVGAYVSGVARYRTRRGRTWSTWRTASWTTGALTLGLGTSPIAEGALGHASGHMVQHVALGMLAPLALVLGAPLTLLLGASPPAVGRRVGACLRRRPVHAVTHPATAAALHVGGMYLLYLTPLHALSVAEDAVHHVVHVHFVVAGYLYSWAVAGPDPARGRPGMRTRLLVLVLAAGAHSHLAKLLYARADELPPRGPWTAAETELAARWMYYGGDVAEVLLAAALFAGWYRLAGRSRRRVSASSPTPPPTSTYGQRALLAEPPAPRRRCWNRSAACRIFAWFSGRRAMS